MVSDMKKVKKDQLWYNSASGNRRDALLERSGLADMAADREGRALLMSYCRMYRAKL